MAETYLLQKQRKKHLSLYAEATTVSEALERIEHSVDLDDEYLEKVQMNYRQPNWSYMRWTEEDQRIWQKKSPSGTFSCMTYKPHPDTPPEHQNQARDCYNSLVEKWNK